MPRPTAYTKETLALARRLREQDGKTFEEIAKITGISKSSLNRAALKFKWKDAAALEKADDRKNIIAIAKEIKPAARITQPVNISDDDRNQIIEELKDLGLKDPKEFAKKGLLFAAQLAMREAARGDIKALAVCSKTFSTLAELTGAFDVNEGDRKLTVMVPAITETYEDPPEESHG